MADDATVIREFLVALGFKVDQTSFAKFGKGVEGATLAVAKLGGVVVATATAVAAFTGAVAEKMDDLYWASQRLQSGVAAIQGFTYAISQMGGSAAGARQSLENLARSVATNPGIAALLRGWGITNPSNAVQTETQLGQRFRSLIASGPSGNAIAWRQAQMLGFDYDTFWAITHGNPNQYQGDVSRIYKGAGANADQIALHMHQYDVALKRLEFSFTALAEVAADRFGPTVLRWADTLEKAVEVFLKWTNSAEGKHLEDAFSNLIDGIGNFVFTLGRIAAWAEPKAGMTPGEVAANVMNFGAAVAHGPGDLADTLSGKDPYGAGGPTMYQMGKSIFEWIEKNTSASSPGGRIADFFRKRGFTEQGADVMESQAAGESSFNPNLWGDNHTAFGLFQWRGKRLAELLKRYGPKPTWDQQLQFALSELTQGSDPRLRKAGAALQNPKITQGDLSWLVTKLFENPKNPITDAAKRDAYATVIRNVNITQNITQHIQGGSNPQATAAAVGSAFTTTVNQELVRNLRRPLR